MKMICGLRVVLAPVFKDALDPRIRTIMDTLRSTYADFDGAAFTWISPETNQEILLYQALRSEFARANYKIIAHIARFLIDTYNFAEMKKYVDLIVVNTHDFAVHGKAYPPCMYQSGGIMDVVDKNLVDVLNRILTLAPFLNTKLVPTVSTVGKKYVFEDANNVNVGDRVDLSKPPEDSPLFKFCQDRTTWTTKMDDKTKCDTAFNNMKEWIGFESPTSVAIKTELVKKKKLPGIAVLNIEQDGREACTGDKKPYLLGAVHRGLRMP
ncbi:endochitinase-like [Dermacentor variabilis]|uniref:endochitinase-like n=1 Tax=Dermacentor variabilis TaxID=34621 RepID=UPI003F5B6583